MGMVGGTTPCAASASMVREREDRCLNHRGRPLQYRGRWPASLDSPGIAALVYWALGPPVTIRGSPVLCPAFNESRMTSKLPDGSSTTATGTAVVLAGPETTRSPGARTATAAWAADSPFQLGPYCYRVLSTCSMADPGSSVPAWPMSSSRQSRLCPSASP